jgi:putative hemolysin
MTSLQVTYLVVLGICILLSGFFSGSETALIAVPRERVHQLLGSDRRARRVEALLAEPERTLSTLLFANNFVNILAASVATVLFVDLVGEDFGPWVATLAVTGVILIVGEITPKSLATRFPERFSLLVAPPIYRLSLLIRPISQFFLAITRGLLRLLRVGTGDDRSAVTEADIRAMAILGERTGDIARAEREIIDSLFSLADRTVRDVMTPRTDVHTLESPVTIDDIRSAVASTGHSRFPVIKEDIDHLQGVLYVKDVLGMGQSPAASDIHRAMRDPVYVPESKSVLDLLLEMRAGRLTFSVVTDEHGGIEGIVTIKDLVSVLVGELQDEYDIDEPPDVVELGPGQWLVEGRAPIDEAGEALGVELPEGEYTTVAGLILDRLGRIPAAGDEINVDGLGFEVVRMVRNRVDRVKVTGRP